MFAFAAVFLAGLCFGIALVFVSLGLVARRRTRDLMRRFPTVDPYWLEPTDE